VSIQQERELDWMTGERDALKALFEQERRRVTDLEDALRALHDASVHPLLYEPKCRDQRQRKRAMATWLAASDMALAALKGSVPQRVSKP
jgi:aminoglycoside phosphotransferase (APT) family kinase protein